ncbi:winged helix-turn-helix domain-containing protein [Escherichia coli]|nr:winged helix-turn-helix domain-containing protein [Escherichia coli]
MSSESKKQFLFDDFILYSDGSLFHKNEQKHIPPKELGVLMILLESAGQVVKKEFIIESIWPEMIASDESLTRCIYTLRRILGETKEKKFIQTIYGRGYKLTKDVVVISPSQPKNEQRIIAILPFKSADKDESIFMHNELIQSLSKYAHNGIGILPATITSDCDSLEKLNKLISNINPDYYLIGQMIKSSPKRFKLFIEYVQSKGHKLIYHESIDLNKKETIEIINTKIWNIIKNNTPGLRWSIKNNNEIASMDTAIVYLHGKKNLYDYDVSSLKKSEKLFNYCINVNPYHSLPYSSLAETYISQIFLGLKKQKETLPLVHNALNMAVKLEPGNPVALGQLAFIKSIMKENTLASILFKQAKLLAPDLPETTYYEAMYQLSMKEYAQALNSISKCIEKDTLSIQFNITKAWLLYLNNRGNEAIECIQRLVASHQNHQMLNIMKYFLKMKLGLNSADKNLIHYIKKLDKYSILYKEITNKQSENNITSIHQYCTSVDNCIFFMKYDHKSLPHESTDTEECINSEKVIPPTINKGLFEQTW